MCGDNVLKIKSFTLNPAHLIPIGLMEVLDLLFVSKMYMGIKVMNLGILVSKCQEMPALTML